MEAMETVIIAIAKKSGVAGQLSYSATVARDGETSIVTFVGSVYRAPIVMITEGMPQGIFVAEPSRFGEFGEQWVRNFFEGG